MSVLVEVEIAAEIGSSSAWASGEVVGGLNVAPGCSDDAFDCAVDVLLRVLVRAAQIEPAELLRADPASLGRSAV